MIGTKVRFTTKKENGTGTVRSVKKHETGTDQYTISKNVGGEITVFASQTSPIANAAGGAGKAAAAVAAPAAAVASVVPGGGSSASFSPPPAAVVPGGGSSANEGATLFEQENNSNSFDPMLLDMVHDYFGDDEDNIKIVHALENSRSVDDFYGKIMVFYMDRMRRHGKISLPPSGSSRSSRKNRNSRRKNTYKNRS